MPGKRQSCTGKFIGYVRRLSFNGRTRPTSAESTISVLLFIFLFVFTHTELKKQGCLAELGNYRTCLANFINLYIHVAVLIAEKRAVPLTNEGWFDVSYTR